MNTKTSKCETLPGMLLNGLDLLARRKLSREALDNSTDAELVRLSLRGNTKAYEVIVRRYQKLVYNVVYQTVQNHETAADVTQDTFVRAYTALGSFRLDAAMKPWLLRIGTNCALNKIREAKSREHDSLDFILEENAYAEPSSAQDVEKEVELRLSQLAVMDALKKLPARHRLIFLLRYQHDLPYAEIAQISDETESAVKTILFRTREKLKRMLSSQEEGSNV